MSWCVHLSRWGFVCPGLLLRGFTCISVAFGGGYNPGMRIWVLTAWMLCGTVMAQTAAQPLHVDRVVVLKKERTLQLLSGGKVIKSYRVALGGYPLGAKTRQGDHKTPEGIYVLDSRNAHSQFHKSIHISYPNARDRAAARAKGVSPGGDVFVHGLPNGYGWVGASHRAKDWTDGCIAVTDEEIEEIWKAVGDGTAIEIRP
jgi:murein L,D-transpeptidase YafK